MSIFNKNIIKDKLSVLRSEKDSSNDAQQKISALTKNNLSSRFNPFLKSNGELVNPYIDYQGLLNANNVNDRVKSYIQEATGLSPIVNTGLKNSVYTGGVKFSDGAKQNLQVSTDNSEVSVGTGEFKNSVGKRITDTSKYNNGAAKGQCVWYALGRASERNGKTITIGGNGNSMFYQAKKGSQLSAKPENLKGNTLLCFNKGTSSAGQKYGHVIFIEDVIGDTVYYTEGGSGYYKNGTDGVVKTATRQQILNGVNSSGGRIGSEPLGLIDLSKY